MINFTRKTSHALCMVAGIVTCGIGMAGKANAQTILISEDFSTASQLAPPAGWTNSDNGGSSPTGIWSFSNPGSRSITGGTPGFSDPFAILDSDYYGSGEDQNADLETPAFDASVIGAYQLDFDNNWEQCCDATGNIQVWNGTTWTTVYSMSNLDNGDGTPDPSTHVTFILPGAALGGSSTAKVRFHYQGSWDYWWAIDNVTITRLACTQPAATFTVTPDCTNNQFSVNTNITSLGNATSVAITDGTNTYATATATGAYTAGPFASPGPVTITLVNNVDNACNLNSSPFFYNCASLNDECSGAVMLTSGASCTPVAGTTAGSTVSVPGPPGSCVDFGSNNDVWFSFQAANTAENVTLSNIVPVSPDVSYYEVGIVGYSGTCGSLTPIACNMGGFDPASPVDASITMSGLTVGQTYYIKVWSDYAEDNNFNMVASETNFNICVKDPVQGAICSNPLVVNSATYSYSGNTADFGSFYQNSPGSGCGTTSNYLSGDAVVFSYTASATGTIDISLTNIGDTYAGMFVYNDCADIGTACADGVVNGNATNDLFINAFNVTANQRYYIVISTWASPQSTTFTLNVTGATTPLAVTMGALDGKLNSKNLALLSWNTYTEANNKGFEIQRSNDSRNFSTIGWVGTQAAAGNSTRALAYSYADKQTVTGDVYYRLRQVDQDGKYTLSNTVRLNAQQNGIFKVTAAPNPVNNSLIISTHGAQGEHAMLYITDITGKNMMQLQVTGAETKVDMSNLAQGIYLVKYTDNDHIQTIKISKQ